MCTVSIGHWLIVPRYYGIKLVTCNTKKSRYAKPMRGSALKKSIRLATLAYTKPEARYETMDIEPFLRAL